MLYLDARSAFDVVQRQLLIKNLYHVQGGNSSLLFIDSRLANRQTVVDYDGHLMGPINDEQGLEQGGISSSEFYKIFGKEQLSLAQHSNLGVPLGSVMVAAIGQADDTVLISNDIVFLSYLLDLTKLFCHKYLVELCAEKTHLQVYGMRFVEQIDVSLESCPIEINGQKIPFSNSAEHVGVVRSTNGNSQALFQRFRAHHRALASVLHQGMARGHRANPALSLRIERLYASPVLFSGLASLILTKTEVTSVEKHHRESLRQLLKLFKGTPRSVTYFLAGSLPGSALLHIRQLSLFGMIARNDGSILNRHAINVFSYQTIIKKSWFHQIRSLCLLYNLPHPQQLLCHPLEKLQYKKLIKSKVVDYWESLLRSEADKLNSVPYFNPLFMSLTTVHPIFSTAGHAPLQVAKAKVQAIMLSGRYRCGALTRHWIKNYDGGCKLSSTCKDIIEDLPHILTQCSALITTRNNLFQFAKKYVEVLPDCIRFLIYVVPKILFIINFSLTALQYHQ